MNKIIAPPAGLTESEEADWLYNNRELIEEDLRAAMKEGRTGRGTMMRQALEADLLIHLDEQDAAKARTVANRKGMSYQAYVKMLVHQALERDGGLKGIPRYRSGLRPSAAMGMTFVGLRPTLV